MFHQTFSFEYVEGTSFDDTAFRKEVDDFLKNVEFVSARVWDEPFIHPIDNKKHIRHIVAIHYWPKLEPLNE